MVNNAREKVVKYLINEIWGPAIPPEGDGIVELPEPEPSGTYSIPGEGNLPRILDKTTGDLLVTGAAPKMIYGTGVLHSQEDWDSPEESDSNENADEPNQLTADDAPLALLENHVTHGVDDEPSSFSLDQSQKRKPSAMGFTSELVLFDGDICSIQFKGAVYDEIKLSFNGRAYSGWKRREVELKGALEWSSDTTTVNELISISLEGELSHLVSAKVRFRKSTIQTDAGHGLVATFVIKNETKEPNEVDVFQSVLSIRLEGEGHLRSSKHSDNSDSEQRELDHLYRHTDNFAVGHGTSVTWPQVPLGEKLREIETTSLPTFYQEVLDFEGAPTASMDDLARASQLELTSFLRPIVTNFEQWISEEQAQSLSSAGDPEVTARLVARASHVLDRIKQGFALVTSDEFAFRAFTLANKAMYEQQKNGRRAVREWSRDSQKSYFAAEPFSLPPISEPSGKFGRWRPFQLAFLLAVLPGLVDPKDESREEVDLIFFPTGGGKTEAYLGASAVSIILQRLKGNVDQDFGVNVLMRYTLRLLTIQQFERSSGLICALEQIRQTMPQTLGSTPISIGVWLGVHTTPNWRKEALSQLKDVKNRKSEDPNPFVLNRCPVCAAEFGWDGKHWRGYEAVPKTGKYSTLRFVCPDSNCYFGNAENPLPIWITDEDVYSQKPTFVLGTVDKFAQMAWQERARYLFGFGADGVRVSDPPVLVVQDELHLISGPLGSMVGLYEPIIEELCTDRRGPTPIRPKIIASTATTRKYETQIDTLYGREKVMLFPQAISRANETFFSRVMYEHDGVTKKKGSLYIGVNPATYMNGQLSAARVAAILKQAPNMESDPNNKDMDFYRTSLWFFNSLRELGMTLTLMQSTVRDLIAGMRVANRLPGPKASYPYKIMELTSRIDSNKVSSSLAALSRPSWDPKSFDTCLASSIMEVGVDVPRLGLLTIMSQPKTTSQYIQVSGRVGRSGDAGPGLVVMLYNTTRARDRSIYERFQSYHETLYAQVEPISLTPFAVQALNHGLKGALISQYRMTSPMESKPNDVNWESFDKAVAVLRARLIHIDSGSPSLNDFELLSKRLKAFWSRYRPTRWDYTYKEENIAPDNESVPALMRKRRERMDKIPNEESFMVPTSMRNVDGQTKLVIMNPYNFHEEEN